ncbi:hypothetical protein Tco_1302277 [Tanacetum coccineum]
MVITTASDPSPPLPPILSPLPLSPPLLVSSPTPASPTYQLGYRAAMIRLRAEAPSTSHPPPLGTPPSGTPPLLPILAPTSSPPLMLPSVVHRADMPEVCLLPRKRSCIALGPRYEVRESSSSAAAKPIGGSRVDYGFVTTMDREIRHDTERYVGYGIMDTWDEILKDMSGAPATDKTELGRRVTDLVTTMIQDTDEIYTRLDDAQMISELQAADRRRQAVIIELLAADRRRQAQFIKALKLLKRLQTQMTEFESQQGPAKGPAQPDAPEEAGSSS